MANPSRRSVLRAGVIAAAVAAPLAASENVLAAVAGGMSSGLRRSTFVPHVKSSFALVGGGTKHKATLVKVGDLVAAPSGHEAKFRLLFRVKGARPAEGVYRLRHSHVAAMDLFVAPVGAKGDLYEAVVDAG
jgi:hypothetical protein